MRKNPEFTEEEAKEYLQKNISDYGDLNSISTEFILKDVDDVRVPTFGVDENRKETDG